MGGRQAVGGRAKQDHGAVVKALNVGSCCGSEHRLTSSSITSSRLLGFSTDGCVLVESKEQVEIEGSVRRSWMGKVRDSLETCPTLANLVRFMWSRLRIPRRRRKWRVEHARTTPSPSSPPSWQCSCRNLIRQNCEASYTIASLIKGICPRAERNGEEFPGKLRLWRRSNLRHLQLSAATAGNEACRCKTTGATTSQNCNCGVSHASRNSVVHACRGRYRLFLRTSLTEVSPRSRPVERPRIIEPDGSKKRSTGTCANFSMGVGPDQPGGPL